MGWADDFAASYKGQQQRQEAAQPASGSYIGGFVSSTVSGVGELFGMQPFESAAEFRQENPIGGIASQMGGLMLPYVGMFKASQTVRGAAALEGAMGAVPGVRSLSMASTPIRYQAAKEVIRYTPLELGRLGIGLATTDDWQDYGTLLADVGLSTALTGGFGAIGGFFRAGGAADAEVGRVVGTDVAFAPFAEFRMSRVAGAEVTGDLPLADVQQKLLVETLTERPFEKLEAGVRGKYVYGLEGGTPETDALVNTLFRPSGKDTGENILLRRPLMRQDGTWALDDAKQQELLGAVGMQNMEELAESGRYFRHVTVKSERAAGVLAKAFDESPAMQFMGDGVMMAKEAEGGLYIMGVRTKAPDVVDGATRAATGREMDVLGQEIATFGKGRRSAEQKAKIARYEDLQKLMAGPSEKFGSLGIGRGDEWLMFKTDQPQRFLPKSHKVAELNVQSWARYREPYRLVENLDPFNSADNMLLKVLTPKDFADIRNPRISKQTMLSRISERVADKVGDVTGLAGQRTVRQMSETIYNSVAPTMFLQGKNALYGRMFSLLRNRIEMADQYVNRIMGGAVKVTGNPLKSKNIEYGEGYAGYDALRRVVAPLDDNERQLFAMVSQAQKPADAVAELSATGMVSTRLQHAIETFQNVNKKFWEDVLLPSFKASGLDGKFDLLEGYIMPRIFKGDWFVPVLDSQGRTQWLASGTLAEARKAAQKVVDEAGTRGKTWTVGKERGVMSKEKDGLADLHDMVQMQLGRDADTQEIITRALRKMEIDRMQRKKGGVLPNFNLPKTLSEKRSGLHGSPDEQVFTVDDIIKATTNHFRQLSRFAAYNGWRRRWLEEAQHLQKIDPKLHDDLQRKANQYLGFEGQLTNTLNNVLQPLFGHHLGGKAATRIAQQTNELMYNWNLAIGNPTFAMLNLLNPLQTVAPWIAFMTHAPTEAAERMMGQTLRFGADGLPRSPLNFLHPMKVLRQSMGEMKKPSEELLEHYQRAKIDAVISPKLYEGFVGEKSRMHQTFRETYDNAGGGVTGGWEFIKKGATFMAEKSEEFSRIQAFTSAHILGRDFFGLSGDALYQFAKTGTMKTMYGYSVIDRSRIFTGPVGSMFGLFKNWQMHFIGTMAEYAGIGIKQGVWAPMLWQFGVVGAVGGLGAMGPLKWVADSLAKWNSDSPTSYLWLQENWQGAADEIYFGLPALFGASLQASASMPGTDVRNDLTHLSNFVFLERAKAAGKAVGEAWDYSDVNGENPLRNPNIRDKMLQAFAPRAIFRAFASAEGDYVKSMATGYPQVRDVSPASRLLYGLGLNQVEIERQQVASRELWKSSETRKERTQQLGIAYADAWQNGDPQDQMDVLNQAVALGIEQSKVVKSAQTRMRREQESDSLSRYGSDAQRYLQAWQE